MDVLHCLKANIDLLHAQVAGVHWWYRTASHAAELTAGYFNTARRDGYAPIAELCARHGAGMTLTCVEMCDEQHPPRAACGPEGLLRQVCGTMTGDWAAHKLLCGDTC